MKLLLVGASGQVGTELLRDLGALGELKATTRTGQLPSGARGFALDLLDAAAIEALIEAERPDVVVNAAAYTAVDRAESEPEIAASVNARAPAAMARACKRVNAALVHFSTDYVFDGKAGVPYTEDATMAPLGVYGRSKFEGERAIRESGARHLILRTAWVYALHGQNFLRTMLRLARERDELRVVADQYGCPTPAWLISECTARLLITGAVQAETYHVVTSGCTTWHGFACGLLEEAQARGLVARMPRVLPIRTEDYPTPATRPAYSVLDNQAIAARLGAPLPRWRDALRAAFERHGTAALRM